MATCLASDPVPTGCNILDVWSQCKDYYPLLDDIEIDLLSAIDKLMRLLSL